MMASQHVLSCHACSALLTLHVVDAREPCTVRMVPYHHGSTKMLKLMVTHQMLLDPEPYIY